MKEPKDKNTSKSQLVGLQSSINKNKGALKQAQCTANPRIRKRRCILFSTICDNLPNYFRMLSCSPSALQYAELHRWSGEAIALRLEAIAIRKEAMASRLEVMASRLEAIAIREEAIVGWRSSLLRRPSLLGRRPSLVGWRPLLVGWRPSLLGGVR